MSGMFVASALGGALRTTLTAAEVEQLWNEADDDLREKDDDGTITLWARSEFESRRLAPIYLRPVDRAQAA